ncbi:MAG TPA: acetolactate synthase, partial [Phycisphaerales bacterium]|nr:acetolactate synthase [Phycisphaerales bacterium]
MAKQLTVFVENRPGRMKSVSDILLENRLNIWAFAIQDRGEFGLMKLIVDRPEQARLALADHGFACALKEVLAVTAPDRPGNLDRLTTALLDSNV